MKTVQPCIDAVNETTTNVEHAKKKIKIGKIAEPEIINKHISNLRKICDWTPNNMLAFPSSSILSSAPAKEFV